MPRNIAKAYRSVAIVNGPAEEVQVSPKYGIIIPAGYVATYSADASSGRSSAPIVDLAGVTSGVVMIAMEPASKAEIAPAQEDVISGLSGHSLVMGAMGVIKGGGGRVKVLKSLWDSGGAFTIGSCVTVTSAGRLKGVAQGDLNAMWVFGIIALVEGSGDNAIVHFDFNSVGWRSPAVV